MKTIVHRLAGAACAALLISSPAALPALAQGKVETVPFNNTLDTDLCGDFMVRITESGTLRIVRVNTTTTHVVWNVDASITNLATGKIIRGKEEGPVFTTVNPDGSSRQIIHGIATINVPEHGLVLHFGSNTIIDYPADPNLPPTVVSVKGPNDSLAAVCDFLRTY